MGEGVMSTFIFHGASQATFTHHGKNERRRGDIFTLQTDHGALEIYVSNEGRSIRVWSPKLKRELR
jgi:hypothetical protein